ncbi:exopolysaccharide biosynthesis protein [Roseibacillus ishigakijimensis]|uniref:Exopolysaccharide biosynthesis protein n=1 Tax=Roseibacillus ishigakijimensis TaxID=454146 RepID=A0A934VLG0_9BACT|nr:exopolysaccharide biosynthesis protein [Roseibacillus ishigakijimensis]MBK1834649.1 exopolysaccharide biosynthesis protein [Roseibacillus ishigakijimensis]
MPKELTTTLEELDDQSTGGKVKLGDLVESFEHRGFGPIFLVPALVALVPPLSGIPGVPALCGLVTVTIAVQMILGRSYPWLPERLRALSVSREKVEKMQQKGRPFAEWIDSLSAQRLTWLTHPVSVRLLAFLIAFLALSMIPLELVPFGAAAPAGAIVLLSLGLMARDGLMILCGWLISFLVVWLIASNL